MQARWLGIAVFFVMPSLFLALVPLPALVSGIVADAEGPVRGASVGRQGQSKRVITDSRGRFCLATSERSGRLIATKPGYRIASGRIDTLDLRLQRLPAEDNEDYQWIGPDVDPQRPQQCGNCHADILREWSSSGHARSATNPRFLNIYQKVVDEYPEGAGVCASCHAPTLRSPTLEYDVRTVRGTDARGVHCDYCHKIESAAVDQLGTRFGRDGLKLLRPPAGQQFFFGPLDDAVRAGESFAHAPLYKDSAYCASCHEGVLFGVHVYGTYSEWLVSPARRQGQQCQNCHMTPTGRMTNIAPEHGGVERAPDTLASHGFPGGTLEMLRRCLTVEVREFRTPKGLEVTVISRASNVGHHVPTGFIDRSLTLLIETSARLLSGSVLPAHAGRAYEGRPGWLYAKTVFDDAGRGPLTFWKPREKVIDTRLHPEQQHELTFLFAHSDGHVNVRLVYRNSWSDAGIDVLPLSRGRSDTE